MRALIVTNMYPSAERPAFGSFVRDQVEALRHQPGVDLSLQIVTAGGAGGYLRAPIRLRRASRRSRFDVVHAHFGLSAWPARAVRADLHVVTLHGTDLAHPRSRAVTLSSLPFQDVVATVSDCLQESLPPWVPRSRREVLPCGVALGRFHPIPREEARRALGLDPRQPVLLFPADPQRPEKRHDRAVQVAGDTPLLTLGGVEPERVPLYVNAANAVLVPSEREGFGLAVLEALACDVPVLATPVGVAPQALCEPAGPEDPAQPLSGCLCAPFDAGRWRDAVAPHLEAEDPRASGRQVAARYSSERMARRVLEVWTERLARGSG